ncbi:TonB-dependent receptor family protein [Parahaliea mediterranea]|uniref:TonB-dependent receptor family protein n=1 Tax=Parahaliea mediterranea TaxID=651086 RepID=UPI0019D477BC|nr:TonB-dependent receptor [Parahaliea mediterranea]
MLGASVLTLPDVALAQSATPGSTVIEEVVVVGQRGEAARRLESLAGGADIVLTSEIPVTANLTLSRALAATPGVIVQDFFGGNDQPRVQVRGSGLQQNPVERGILMLENGLPINRADGSYVIGLGNPAQAESIEVYRGYLANRLGATVLGGALNFISPTGTSAPGGKFALSGGSFGQVSALGQYGLDAGSYDALLQADVSQRDGYRDYNASERYRLGGNIGKQLNDNISVRLFGSYTDLDFDVAGPLTWDLLRDDPESVYEGPTVTPIGLANPGPDVIRDRPRRAVEQLLLGGRASGRFGANIVDLSLGYGHGDDSFRFPISAGLRETESDDLSAVLRYAYKPDESRALPLLEVTVQHFTGSADRDYYINLSGEKGPHIGANELDADTTSLNLGLHIPLGASLTLSPSVAYSHATRENRDVFGDATRPTASYHPMSPDSRLPDGAVPTVANSYDYSYSGWSPALALSWQVNPRHLLFVAYSRAFEPPTHDDLLATVNGTPFSSAGRPAPPAPNLPAAAFATPDLDAQSADTLEAGWRGSAGMFRWDATLYYSRVDNELLSLRDLSGVALAAANADKTIHAGAEISLQAQLGSRLQGRLVYNHQKFEFDGDRLRGNNRLAGAPSDWLNLNADYRITHNWSLGANLRWMMKDYPLDNYNTLDNEEYAVFDLRSDYRLNDRTAFFVEAANVFDENYASSTLIVDQARPDQAAYLPGDGRGFFAGIELLF